MINSTTVGSALIVLVLAAAALLAGHVWGQGHEPNRPYISPTASATSTLPVWHETGCTVLRNDRDWVMNAVHPFGRLIPPSEYTGGYTTTTQRDNYGLPRYGWYPVSIDARGYRKAYDRAFRRTWIESFKLTDGVRPPQHILWWEKQRNWRHGYDGYGQNWFWTLDVRSKDQSTWGDARCFHIAVQSHSYPIDPAEIILPHPGARPEDPPVKPSWRNWF